MEKQSRRGLLKNAAKAAMVATSAAMIAEKASALPETSDSQPSRRMEKRLPAGFCRLRRPCQFQP